MKSKFTLESSEDYKLPLRVGQEKAESLCRGPHEMSYFKINGLKAET